MKTMIDPVTGNDYAREHAMYVRYHGLSDADATRVMSASTYGERDAIFWAITRSVIDEITK